MRYSLPGAGFVFNVNVERIMIVAVVILAWVALICCAASLSHHIYMLAEEDSNIEEHVFGAILMVVCMMINIQTLITFS